MNVTKCLVLDEAGASAAVVVEQMEAHFSACECTVVHNREGLQTALRTQKPDIIISESRFSTDAFSVKEAIDVGYALAPGIPIIIFSDHLDDDRIFSCIRAGASDYVAARHKDRLAVTVRIALERMKLEETSGAVSEALLRAGRHWRATFDAMSDAICVTDLRGCIIRANVSFKRMVDQPWPEVVGTAIETFSIAQENIWAGIAYDELIKNGSRFETEVQKDQTWLHISIEPHVSKDRKIAEIIHIFSDITKEKISQQQLKMRAVWMQTINQFAHKAVQQHSLSDTLDVAFTYLERNFDFSFGCILMTHTDDTVFEVAGISHTGKNIAEEAGILPGVLYDSSEIPDMLKDMHKLQGDAILFEALEDELIGGTWTQTKSALTGNGIICAIKMPIVIADRHAMILYLGYRYNVQLKNEEWEFLQNMSEYIALSARNRRLYEELRESYNELDRIKDITARQRRMEAMGQIASGIAHDVNNTLVPVSLYTEALLGQGFQLGDKARKYIGSIRDAIHDIEGITSRLRTFYRMEESTQVEPLLISALFDEVVELTRPRWKADSNRTGNTIQMTTHVSENLPDIIGNAGEIREALVNLIFNAVDALPEEGSISFSAWVDRSSAYISVQDTGTGMTEDQKERCLEPFFTTKGVRGSGLGLPGVYGVVQRHGGSLQIDSDPGSGTSITIALPRAPTLQKSTRVFRKFGCIESLHILVVDDDTRVREALVELLSFEGHNLFAAKNGPTALEYLQNNTKSDSSIDLVITDLGMEGMDGIAVAQAVKQQSSDTPVILLTGWGAFMKPEQKPEFVDILLTKPPTMEKIRSALGELQLYEEYEDDQKTTDD